MLAAPVAGPAVVDLWVESLGRVNYGPRQAEPKGITGGVRHERQYLHGVRARGLRLDAFGVAAVGKVPFAERPSGDGASGAGAEGAVRGCTGGSWGSRGPGTRCCGCRARPGLRLGERLLSRPVLDGRPQEALFVPGPVLREGANEVWVLELEGDGAPGMELGVL